MHPLSLSIDGIPQSWDDGVSYLKIEEAIRWHEVEIEETGGEWPGKILAKLKAAAAQYATGGVMGTA